MDTLLAALNRCSKGNHSHSAPAACGTAGRTLGFLGSIGAGASVLGMLLACTTLLTGCKTDESRFLDASAVIKKPKTSPQRPIDWGLSPADYTPEMVPNSAPPNDEDLTYRVEDYVLGPTDIVDITVLDLYEPNQEAVLRKDISTSGYIDLPLVGMLKAEGLTAPQLKQAVINAYVVGDILRNPTVSVAIVAERQNTYSALGAVARPGLYNILRKDTRLLEALAQPGGIIQTNIRYIYVIRPAPATAILPEGAATMPTSAPVIPELPQLPTLPTLPNLPSLPTLPEPSTKPAGNGAAPAVTPTPTPTPSSTSSPNNDSLKELTDALMGTSSKPATGAMPRYSLSSEGQAVPASAATATAPADDKELGKALKPGGGWVYDPNRGWIQVSAGEAASHPSGAVTATGPANESVGDVAATRGAKEVIPPAPRGPESDPFGWRKVDKSDQARIIAINLRKLQEGDPRMNVIIRNNDIIMVPPLEMGEFYVMGEVQRPGVYSLSGRRVTVKMAIAAAGNLGPLSYPENTILIRRIGDSQEQIFPLDVEAIFRGEQNDLFLKPDDVIAVGQSCLSPFLLVMRNAFRVTYGFGFIWDRNFADPLPPGVDHRRFTEW